MDCEFLIFIEMEYVLSVIIYLIITWEKWTENNSSEEREMSLNKWHY